MPALFFPPNSPTGLSCLEEKKRNLATSSWGRNIPHHDQRLGGTGPEASPSFTFCTLEELKQSLVFTLRGGPCCGAYTLIEDWEDRSADPAFHFSRKVNSRRLLHVPPTVQRFRAAGGAAGCAAGCATGRVCPGWGGSREISALFSGCRARPEAAHRPPTPTPSAASGGRGPWLPLGAGDEVGCARTQGGHRGLRTNASPAVQRSLASPPFLPEPKCLLKNRRLGTDAI